MWCFLEKLDGFVVSPQRQVEFCSLCSVTDLCSSVRQIICIGISSGQCFGCRGI
jgi:hypothetical protein